MATLTGTPRPTDPVGSSDFAAFIAAATGLTITDATVNPTNWFVTGPTISESNRAAIQAAINTYVYDPTVGVTLSPFVVTLNGVQPVVWTNQPAALTAVPNSVVKVPLHTARFARLTTNVVVAGFNGSTLLLVQVSLDGTNYINGPSVNIGTTGFKVSTLSTIPEQYRTDVFVRLAGSGGNATADPSFGLTTLQMA